MSKNLFVAYDVDNYRLRVTTAGGLFEPQLVVWAASDEAEVGVLLPPAAAAELHRVLGEWIEANQ